MHVGAVLDDFDDDYFGVVPGDFDDDYFGHKTHDDYGLDFDCICCGHFSSLPLID